MYVCDMCPYTIIDLTKMKNHQAKHTGETPWKCELCNQRFSTHMSCKRHTRLYCSALLSTKRKRMPMKRKRRQSLPDMHSIPSVMVLHSHTPSTVKPHPCIQCGKAHTCRSKHARCHTCAPYSGSSCAEQEAMKGVRDEMGVDDLIFGNAGEQYRIPNTPYRVDGYSPSRRAIYEYHSTKYHGQTDKCISRLHTLNRMDALCALGYTVYCVWGRSFLERHKKNLSMAHYVERHWPSTSPRPLPPLDTREAKVVESLIAFLTHQNCTTSKSKCKSQLTNLVDYAVTKLSPS